MSLNIISRLWTVNSNSFCPVLEFLAEVAFTNPEIYQVKMITSNASKAVLYLDGFYNLITIAYTKKLREKMTDREKKRKNSIKF